MLYLIISHRKKCVHYFLLCTYFQRLKATGNWIDDINKAVSRNSIFVSFKVVFGHYKILMTKTLLISTAAKRR